ncbi:hypothetical protein GCM10010483_17180 [Actinokineospora diospyrosa]
MARAGGGDLGKGGSGGEREASGARRGREPGLGDACAFFEAGDAGRQGGEFGAEGGGDVWGVGAEVDVAG